MSAMLVVGAVWTVLALGPAILLGRAIRLADTKESSADWLNFAVDGDRFDAPLPAAPMFATASAPQTGDESITRRPFDGG